MQEGLQEEGVSTPSIEQAGTTNVPVVGITQPQLNDLISKKHRDGYEKGRNEALVETKAKAEAQTKNELDPEKIREIMREETKRMSEEYVRAQEIAQGDRVVSEFFRKMQEGESPNPENEESVRKMNFGAIPEIIAWATELPNTRHIMHELHDNGHKLASLLMLARTMPDNARAEMKKLSDSIEKNRAAQAPDVKDPLMQIRPTNTGTDSGKQSIKDLRRQPWLGNRG